MLKTELEKNLGRKMSDSTYTRLKRECKQAQIDLCRENLKVISMAKTYSTKHRLPTAQTLKLFKSFGELPELSLTREQLVSYLIGRTGAHKTTVYRWLPDEINDTAIKETIIKAVSYCIKNRQDVDYPERSKLAS